jgi:CspA family cold shock protein
MLSFLKSLFGKKESSSSPNDSEGSGTLDGTVKFFNFSKGYGFITYGNGEDIFVHVSNVKGRIKIGDKVRFQIEDVPKGKRAIKVERIRK